VNFIRRNFDVLFFLANVMLTLGLLYIIYDAMLTYGPLSLELAIVCGYCGGIALIQTLLYSSLDTTHLRRNFE
jgi:ABC-type branched-subunit amino acid transport system permease subunit